MNQLVNLLILCVSTVAFLQCKKPVATERNRFENSRISLQKDTCVGQCRPVYSIKIHGTGRVVYEGFQHVKRLGKYEKQLSHKESSKLFNAFECANFFDFRSEYSSDDRLPLTQITFEHRGFVRKVRDYSAAPEELQHLEKMVEDVAMSEEDWTKISD